nr:HEAT repeat domain-containing protein [Methanosarcina horonobensis]
MSKNMPERAFESLINALDDEDDEVRRVLAGVLKCLDSEKAVPHLVSALKSHDPIVRRFAAEALGQIKSEKNPGAPGRYNAFRFNRICKRGSCPVSWKNRFQKSHRTSY